MLRLVCVLLLALTTPSLEQASPESPCPEVFTYEPAGSDPGQWYGVTRLPRGSILHSLNIVLDGRADRLENWVGDVHTRDNIDFQITNSDTGISPDPIISVRFFVQYNPLTKTPRVQTIKLNGRDICNSDNSIVTRRPVPAPERPVTPANFGRPASEKEDEILCQQDPSAKACEPKKTCATKWLEINKTNTYIYNCCDICLLKQLCDDGETTVKLNHIGIMTLRKGCRVKSVDFSVNSEEINSNETKTDKKSYFEEKDGVTVLKPDETSKIEKSLLDSKTQGDVSADEINKLLQNIDSKVRHVVTINHISIAAPESSDMENIHKDLSSVKKQLEYLKDRLEQSISYKDEHYYIAIYTIVVVIGAIGVSCLLCCICRSSGSGQAAAISWPVCNHRNSPTKGCNKNIEICEINAPKSIDELEMHKSFNVYSVPITNAHRYVGSLPPISKGQTEPSSSMYQSISHNEEDCTRI